MGGGVAMRAAAKVAGIGAWNRGLRAGESPVVSSARQATRSVASVVSSSDGVNLTLANNNDGKTNSSMEKPYAAIDDWEFAGVENELFMEAGEPMPRLVFGGAPTIQEARQATSDLNDALEKTYLALNTTNKLVSDQEQVSVLLSDSEHVGTKPCVVSETVVTPSASKHAIQAFRLLNESSAAQNVVASIASDPNVWNAVLKNKALVDFLQTHKTSVIFPDMNPNANDSDSFVSRVQSPEASEPESAPAKGFMDYVEDIKQKITVAVVDMINSLSDTFQSLFGGPAKDEYTINPDGSAEYVNKTTVGASVMGLAIMVIMVVVLKRA